MNRVVLVLDSDDTVLATVSRSLLGPLLTAVHRGGFGHLTKVLDEKRSPVRGQLERAGVEPPSSLAIDPQHVVVMIAAPARTGVAVELLRHYGAMATWTTRRGSLQSPMFNTPLSTRARVEHSSDDANRFG